MQNQVALWAASLLLFQSVDPGVQRDPLAAERAEARARYLKVEAELSRASLDALSPEQREARARLLDVFDAYVARADFGVQSIEPGARLPQFVDAEGRRCAMAALLDATGEHELVRNVAAQHNTAWIADLSEHPQFLGWLDRNGLALDEAARIQGPPITLPPPPNWGGGTLGDVVPPAPALPAGPAGPSGPASPVAPFAPPSSPPPLGPASPGPLGPGLAGPFAPGLPGAALSEADSSWWMWWEYNKVEFLRPNRFQLAAPRDDAPGRTFASQLDFMRRVMSPVLVRGVEHRDARIRAAAAGALGRLGGADAVDQLVPLLADSNMAVRDAALLALGSTGADKAQEALLRVAESGKLGNVKEFGRRGRAVAIVALGLGRRAGFDAKADQAVLALAKGASSNEREDLGVAAMTYALLNPSPELIALAEEFASSKSQPLAVRCRATEALRVRDDPATLGALQHLASVTRPELRRSASLALGEFAHPLVVAGLMTAHDLEKEPVASSFQLVSLGRRGGDKAREYLIASLRSGFAMERPWAALGLGILARDGGDALASRALLEALPSVSNADDRPAYWLALGLSRSPEAVEVLRSALRASSDARSRMYAVQALALCGGEEARQALLAQIPGERSALVRSQLALALGVLGVEDDFEAIAATLDDVAEPALQGQIATAIAFHGSSAALAHLGSLLARSDLDNAARAAAMDGLGLLLGRGEPLSLAASSRSGNYASFPAWLREVYATTF